MKTYADCYLCFLRQTLSLTRHFGLDDEARVHVMKRVMAVLLEIDPHNTPPRAATGIQEIIREETGRADPYATLKERSTQDALALLPKLRSLVRDADDPFYTAVRLAIAGNIIDYAAMDGYDLQASVERALQEPLVIDHTAALREAIARAEWVLYLSDNAGETVFDRLLVEQIETPVYYAVRSGPVSNDATEQDATAAGVHEVAQIVANGSNTLGTLLDRCSEEFQRMFAQAEVIIAKGQANYETLSGGGKRLFFLLQTKCDVVARHAGVPVGSHVALQDQGG